MSKHTPGPWEAHDEFWTADTLLITCPDKRTVAEATFRVYADDARGVALANARLIAAAPELLDLAYAFKSYLEDDSRSARRRAACLAETIDLIAKATDAG